MAVEAPGRSFRWPSVPSTLFVLACGAAYRIALMGAGRRGLAYIGLSLVMSALMFWEWRTKERKRWLLVAGLMARLILIGVPPFTTHDVTRYLWDGQVLLSHLDPYLLAPAGAASSLPLGWARPDQNDIPTLYPPLSEALFAACASLGPVWSLWAWKVLVAAASAGTLLLCWKLLHSRGLERHLPLIALSPLMVLEGGVGAHVDVLAAFLLALALGQRRSSWAAGAMLGLATLSKLVPGFLIVPFSAGAERRHAARLIAGALGALAFGYAFALFMGLRPIPGSLLIFLDRWRFGSPLHSALSFLGVHVGPFGVMGLAAASLLPFRSAAHPDLPRRVRNTLAAVFMVSPVVFPWYLVILTPVVALAPSGFCLAWMTAAPLTYEVIDHFDRTGQWRTATWPLLMIVAAWMVGLSIDWAQARDLGK